MVPWWTVRHSPQVCLRRHHRDDRPARGAIDFYGFTGYYPDDKTTDPNYWTHFDNNGDAEAVLNEWKRFAELAADTTIDRRSDVAFGDTSLTKPNDPIDPTTSFPDPPWGDRRGYLVTNQMVIEPSTLRKVD